MVFNAFKILIQRHPIIFNSATGGALCALSDSAAQRIENSHEEPLSSSLSPSSSFSSLDLGRLLAAGFLGILFGGFVYPNAYAAIESRWRGKGFSSLLAKSVVEICTVGIFCNTVSMTSRGLLAGRNPPTVIKHVGRELPRVTLSDVGVWLPYNLVAFSIIPPLIRPTTTALMEASWQTYISLRSHDYQHHPHHHQHHHESRTASSLSSLKERGRAADITACPTSSPTATTPAVVGM